MTKSLTEQWKDGELPDGHYYVVSKKWGKLIDRYRDQTNDCGDEWRGFDNIQGIVDEVLGAVPSYEEFVQQRDFVKDHQKVLIENMNLKQQLAIATKALKEIGYEIGDLESDYGYHYELAKKALKEIEEVK